MVCSLIWNPESAPASPGTRTSLTLSNTHTHTAILPCFHSPLTLLGNLGGLCLCGTLPARLNWLPAWLQTEEEFRCIQPTGCISLPFCPSRLRYFIIYFSRFHTAPPFKELRVVCICSLTPCGAPVCPMRLLRSEPAKSLDQGQVAPESVRLSGLGNVIRPPLLACLLPGLNLSPPCTTPQ